MYLSIYVPVNIPYVNMYLYIDIYSYWQIYMYICIFQYICILTDNLVQHSVLKYVCIIYVFQHICKKTYMHGYILSIYLYMYLYIIYKYVSIYTDIYAYWQMYMYICIYFGIYAYCQITLCSIVFWNMCWI